MVASLGTVQIRFIEAIYEDVYVEGPVRTYCDAWILEKSKWRRRRSQQRGQGPGEDPMHPRWGEGFEIEDVRDDSKVVIDVWNSAAAAGSNDDFFGKVTLRLSELLVKPTVAWHELLPGQVHLQLTWIPTMDGEPTGEPMLLTLPSDHGVPVGRVPPAVLPSRAVVAGANALPRVLPPAAYDDDEFEEEEAAASGGPLKMDFYEYTHRGGSGHGPKENQDAYFVLTIDENNRVYGVLDGHGGEHGRVASYAASGAMQAHLRANFGRLRTEPELVMEEVFEAAHSAIWEVTAWPPLPRPGLLMCMYVYYIHVYLYVCLYIYVYMYK